MKSDARSLYRAVWENPDEDTPRLVFADKLDELGGESNVARARLIRLQIMGDDTPGVDADAECAAIVARWHDRWYPRRSGPLPAGKTVYVRGFVGEFVVDMPGFRGSGGGDGFLGQLESVVQFYPTVTAFRPEGVAMIPARAGYDVNGKAVYIADTFRMFPGRPQHWKEGTEAHHMCFMYPELLEAVGATGPQFDVTAPTAEEALAVFGRMLCDYCRNQMGLPQVLR